MTTFSVKNFERFQHYKDRAPPWIKLYNELLDDYDFGLLPDASKMHLIAIWLLASRSDNKIPYDPTWVARRINATEPVNLAALAQAGFIVTDQPLQTMEQVAIKPLAKCLSREREEGETEKRREEENTSPVAEATRPASEKFDEFWKERPRRDGDDPRKPAEKKFHALVKTGVDPDVIISGAKLASAAARERGIYGTKFVPQTVKWLNDQRFVDYAAEAYIAAPPQGIDWDAVLTTYKRMGIWSKHAGPDLDSPECRAPADMLAKYGFARAPIAPPAIPHLRSMDS